ncbi:ParA family protein (plasmid) [Phormidium sp. CLA17]|uniref:ParA family protein n=1 Tax=Leptolyngbya sp. Cla-17 TaxID=2803751 RepID=UPI001491FAEE|nr:ParA family protein [Leptolyngbya sp. Cla-17]MBM0745736.1 ParA family protein [Leptolyngbya sp. Cla-17]
MAKVIALFNQAGGVGKTSLVLNLGYSLSAFKKDGHVLLIDMDPQASLTTFMGLESEDLEQSVYDAVVGDSPAPVIENIHRMSLIPANLNLSAAELELPGMLNREMRLKQALEPLMDQYDFVLIDCPPSLGLLSLVSLVAATYVLVPIQTQFKAFVGTEKLLGTISRIRSSGHNPNLEIAGFIPTMFDKRNAQDERTLGAIQEQLSGLAKIYPPIPRSTAFADASEKLMPLEVYSPRHPIVPILRTISKGLRALK